MLYYNQSDLFTEAPQDQEARSSVNAGELGFRLTLLFREQISKTVYFSLGDGTPEVVPRPCFFVRQEAVLLALV